MIEEAFARHADRNAYVCMGKYLRYGELDAMSRAWAPGCKAWGCRRARAWRS
jgi:long-chain acyl-CoA synthetase